MLTCGIKGVENSGPAPGFSADRMLITRPIAELRMSTIAGTLHVRFLMGMRSVEMPSASPGSSAAKSRSQIPLRFQAGRRPYRSIGKSSASIVGIHATAPTHSPKMASSLICRYPSARGGADVSTPEDAGQARPELCREWMYIPRVDCSS